MNEVVKFRKGLNGMLEVDINTISDWKGFESLIEFVKKYYSASVLTKYDGPDARRWILECEGIKFELIHDDVYGNYFVAPTEESEAIVTIICHDLENRLRQ